MENAERILLQSFYKIKITAPETLSGTFNTDAENAEFYADFRIIGNITKSLPNKGYI